MIQPMVAHRPMRVMPGLHRAVLFLALALLSAPLVGCSDNGTGSPATPETLSVSTASLPAGIVGAPYSIALSATGGSGPYVWSVISGSVPPGLEIDGAGVIQGIPMAVGTHRFEAAVTSGSQSAQRQLEITIHPGAPSAARMVSGDGQTGETNEPLPAPLVVRIDDVGGNPVPGAEVTWRVTAGGGSVAPAVGTSDSTGLAQAVWTLGVAGENLAEARFEGLSGIVFSATSRPPPLVVGPGLLTDALTGRGIPGTIRLYEATTGSELVTVSADDEGRFQGALDGVSISGPFIAQAQSAAGSYVQTLEGSAERDTIPSLTFSVIPYGPLGENGWTPNTFFLEYLCDPDNGSGMLTRSVIGQGLVCRSQVAEWDSVYIAVDAPLTTAQGTPVGRITPEGVNEIQEALGDPARVPAVLGRTVSTIVLSTASERTPYTIFGDGAHEFDIAPDPGWVIVYQDDAPVLRGLGRGVPRYANNPPTWPERENPISGIVVGGVVRFSASGPPPPWLVDHEFLHLILGQAHPSRGPSVMAGSATITWADVRLGMIQRAFPPWTDLTGFLGLSFLSPAPNP